MSVPVRIHSNDVDEQQLKTCCGPTSDRRLLIFIGSLSISLIVLIFSCYKLASTTDCVLTSVYVGLLSLILGLWMPTPIR